jgi:ubiquinone/menaquinone biosynthesis C-methylase UbiE
MSAILSRAAAQDPRNALEDIKAKQRETWASGNYSVIGTRLQIVGELLAEAADICGGEEVLDVAAGNGNATLAAARRAARVISTDYVPALLEGGRARATAEELDVEFQVADAEALPFANGRFDATVSTFGCMFTPNHRQAAAEMLRVTRSGGRIGMANWTPEGFVGQLFKIVGRHVPPPAGVASPSLWGKEPYIVELFGPQAADIKCVHRFFNFRFESADHWVQVFRDFYGPTRKAYEALPAPAQAALTADLTELLERLNIGGKRSLVVPAEYLEVVVVKA